jgi:hypothetical protein
VEPTHYEFAVNDPGSLTMAPGRHDGDLESAIVRAGTLTSSGTVKEVAVIAVYADGSRQAVYDTLSGHHVEAPGPLFPKGPPTRERKSGLAG